MYSLFHALKNRWVPQNAMAKRKLIGLRKKKGSLTLLNRNFSLQTRNSREQSVRNALSYSLPIAHNAGERTRNERRV